MLTGLDAIDWGALQDAYGSAELIPELLASIATGDVSALEALDNRVNHQGTMMPLAAQVVPFAVELLSVAAAPTARLLVWLGELAAGGDHTNALARGLELSHAQRSRLSNDDPRRRVHDIVADADIENQLMSAQANVRGAAAFALCFSGGDGAALSAALASESDDNVRACALIALALLGSVGGAAPDKAVFEAARASGEPVRSCALIASAYADLAPASEDDLDELLAIVRSGRTVAAIPFCGGALHALATLALVRVATRTTNHHLFALLLDASAGQPTQPTVAARMLDAVFDDVADGPRVATALTETQRAALVALTAAGLVVRCRTSLAANGLPQGDANVARFLGTAPAGPLDTMVDGAPLWRHLADRLAGTRTHARWLEDVGSACAGSGIDAWSICEDAATGPYNVHLPWPRPLNPSSADHQRWLGQLHDLLVETLTAVGDVDLLTAKADELLPNAARPVRFHAALLLATLAAKGDLPARFDPLLTVSMTEEAFAPSMRRVLRSLAVERRRALLEPLSFRHGGFDGPVWFKDAWFYVDALPADEAVARTLAVVRDGKLPLPSERAIEIFVSFGSDATARLEDAASSFDGERRDIVVAALAQIRAN
jgi:hypothetical protein